MVALTQAMARGRAVTPLDAAGTTAKDRVVAVEDQHVGTELGPNRRHQLPQQPKGVGDWLAGGTLPVHSRTAVPVNQPACSSTRRASWQVRCP